MYEKLGKDEEADNMLGELFSRIGGLLASEAAVGQVTAPLLTLHPVPLRQQARSAMAVSRVCAGCNIYI